MDTHPVEIDRLDEEWRGLLDESAAPFQTFSWVRAWYRHFREEYDEALVFSVSRDGVPVAIFPCYRSGRKIRLAGDGICDYQDAIVGADTEDEELEEAFRLFLAWGQRRRPGCDFVLEKLSTRGRLHQILVEAEPRREGVFRHRRSYGPCPCMELADSLDQWLQELPRKLRGDLRRSLNRLHREMPDIEVTVSKGANLGAEEIGEMASFHQTHFRKMGVSPLADSRLVNLFAEVSSDPEVGIRVANLRDGDLSLAVDLGFVRNGTYYGYLTAFDPAYSHLAPGKCLFLKRLEYWKQEEGIQVVDFLCGGERYKGDYTKGNQYAVESMILVPRTAASFPRHLRLLADRWARKWGKKLASRVGVDPKRIRRKAVGKGSSKVADTPARSVGSGARD